MTSTGIDSNTTVIDLTHLCNARCAYCQWGSFKTPDRVHLPLSQLLIPDSSLTALGTERIVISGGEPRLYPQLNEVAAYYRERVRELVIITNGYGLTIAEIAKLEELGFTGVTFSIDSTDPQVAWKTRKTPPRTLAHLIATLEAFGLQSTGMELGINAVVSRPTATWRNVSELLNLGIRSHAEFVKFQPVFDDGFVSSNDPDLRLVESDADALAEIGDCVGGSKMRTNPPGFWMDLHDLVLGARLDPSACDLGPCRSVSTRGELGICFWLSSSRLGRLKDPLRVELVARARSDFEGDKRACKVGPHCFCTQPLEHHWSEGRGRPGLH
jgi:hypothetical protein